MRTGLLAYLSGKPVRLKGVKTTRDGLPSILGSLIPHIRREASPDFLRMLTTILWSSRALSLGKSPDISPITLGPKCGYPSGLGRYARDFWRTIDYNPSRSYVPRSLRFSQFHMTTKQGPNGHALWTCLKDLYTLPDSLVSELKYLGGTKFSSKVDNLMKLKDLGLNLPFSCEPGTSFRRLSYFPDKEFKVRVIAIGDYFSQTVLRPWHSYLFRVLKNIPQDCTFDQGSFITKLDLSKVSSSVDLSSATDRVPIELIKEVLKGLLPSDLVDT